ncbi:MAG: HAD hydrolase-like protein [Hyphomicrobiaceae bacterium]
MHDLTIVFDLDGTLIDTAPDLLAACNRVLESEGIAPLALPELRPAIGLGARHMLETGLELRGESRSELEIDALLDRFLVYYGEHIAVHSRPFPGLDDTLKWLGEAGVALAVCTNKREGLSRRLLDALGLTPAFRAITGRDTFQVCKPHPEHLLGTIRLAGGDPAHAVMVGDSIVDIRTARAANVPVIAVSFGYSDVPVETLEPDATIHRFKDFRAALERLTA